MSITWCHLSSPLWTGLLQYSASTSKPGGRHESFGCAYMHVICLCEYFRSSQMSRCIFCYRPIRFWPLYHNSVDVSVVCYGRQMINHAVVVAFERKEANLGEFQGWPHQDSGTKMFCFLHHILSNTCLCIGLFKVKLHAVLRILKQHLVRFNMTTFFKVM